MKQLWIFEWHSMFFGIKISWTFLSTYKTKFHNSINGGVFFNVQIMSLNFLPQCNASPCRNNRSKLTWVELTQCDHYEILLKCDHNGLNFKIPTKMHSRFEKRCEIRSCRHVHDKSYITPNEQLKLSCKNKNLEVVRLDGLFHEI